MTPMREPRWHAATRHATIERILAERRRCGTWAEVASRLGVCLDLITKRRRRAGLTMPRVVSPGVLRDAAKVKRAVSRKVTRQHFCRTTGMHPYRWNYCLHLIRVGKV